MMALPTLVLYALQARTLKARAKMPMTLFSYQIVPSGGRKEGALTKGNLYIADVEKAKRYVQTVAVPNLANLSDLDVILQDRMGSEIWRGPYWGPPR